MEQQRLLTPSEMEFFHTAVVMWIREPMERADHWERIRQISTGAGVQQAAEAAAACRAEAEERKWSANKMVDARLMATPHGIVTAWQVASA